MNRIRNPLAKPENHQVFDSKGGYSKDAAISLPAMFGIDTRRPKTNSSGRFRTQEIVPSLDIAGQSLDA
jgi:hypothetical protein